MKNDSNLLSCICRVIFFIKHYKSIKNYKNRTHKISYNYFTYLRLDDCLNHNLDNYFCNHTVKYCVNYFFLFYVHNHVIKLMVKTILLFMLSYIRWIENKNVKIHWTWLKWHEVGAAVVICYTQSRSGGPKTFKILISSNQYTYNICFFFWFSICNLFKL